MLASPVLGFLDEGFEWFSKGFIVVGTAKESFFSEFDPVQLAMGAMEVLDFFGGLLEFYDLVHGRGDLDLSLK